jgi:FlaA1/EpsC-like NDP-sugar epimerase
MNETKAETPARKKRVLIVGAGVAGAMILKELKLNPQLSLDPVGLLDDDPAKQDVRIHGVPVLGKLRDLGEIVPSLGVEEVIIAMPTASGKTIRKVVQMCKEANVPSKTIPGMFEIISGSATVEQIRDVDIEDLLRRGVVKTDTEGVANVLRGARVMVTGAGGSIGSELCRQISTFEPDELILVGHGENSIFNIAHELKSVAAMRLKAGQHPCRLHTVIADVRDRERMRQVFQHHRPTVVFHAAAHKHVGLMEENIPDAVTNNVLGTQILVDLSGQFSVERFVMISSDKAVNPTCMMGVTKRVAELVVHEAAERTGRPFVSVRFGNVLGSRGSVVPIFKQQIAAGGPVLVTHPDVKRYFMTIPEAVQLVLQAAIMGEGGEIFVLDMGEPIKIVDLARDLIRLSGLEEGRDIDIQFIGLQRGEKLAEDLFFASESVERSAHEKILVCRNGVQPRAETSEPRKTAGQEGLPARSMRADVERLIAAAHSGASKNVLVLLKQLVPEYQEKVDVPDIEIFPLRRESKTPLSLMEDAART